MRYLVYALIGWQMLGAACVILSIGKPRTVLTPAVALSTVIVCCLEVWVLVWALG